MAKFKIANNPTFKAEVNIPRVGGEPIQIDFTFKTLGRKQLAELFDKWGKDADEWLKMEYENHSDWVDKEIELQVQQIKDIVVSWGFEDEFNDESIYALCETSVGAAGAVIEAYREAYAKTRAGN